MASSHRNSFNYLWKIIPNGIYPWVGVGPKIQWKNKSHPFSHPCISPTSHLSLSLVCCPRQTGKSFYQGEKNYGIWILIKNMKSIK